jgi:hypothetical protein
MTVEQFFTDIWGETEGHVCLSFKTKNGNFEDEFFQWTPGSNESTLRNIRASIERRIGTDCYFVPSVLRGASRKKIAFKASQVVWADFDAGLPELPLEPTTLVQTSEGRFHAYWKLGKVCSSQNTLEQTNKALAQSFGADMSGWDCTQLLRVPGTMNLKRDQATPVVMISSSGISYNLEQFPKVKALQLTVPLSSEGRVPNWLRRFSDFLMIRD